MEVSEILDKIDQNHNIILYDKDVYECYSKIKKDYSCVYFNEPTPVKIRLIKIIKTLSKNNKRSLNRMTITELTDLLINDIEYDRLIIIFNNFERLTYRTAQVYQHLNSLPNIQFISSFSQHFKSDVYPFFKQFEFVNREKYKKHRTLNEINVTYAFYIIISVYCLFIYLKITSSIHSIFVLIGSIWFALIIFRTLFFVGGRP
jgi:hypothetical protein